jgi:uncharacterized membrane protein
MAKKVNITKIKTTSLAKLVGTLNAIIALAVGIVFSITATVAVISNNDFSVLEDVVAAAFIVLIGFLVYPLVGFAFGWLYGGLLGLIWNAVLGTSGGLEIETEEVKV